MKIFLEIKHWQLFLLIIGIPAIIGILDNIILWATEGEATGIYIAINMVNILSLWIFYLWIWSVGSVLSEKLKQKGNLEYNMTPFPVLVFISAIISTVFVIYDIIGNASDFSYTTLFIMAFVALICLFVALNYMVKILVSAEKNGSVKANEFFSEYVMAVFFPIGIWLLQPRINKLA